MANYEESNPFLPKQEKEAETKHETKSSTSTSTSTAKNGGPPPPPPPAVPVGWTANGLPVGEPVMHREPMTQRSQWHSGVFSCLGRNDEFYSSDLEVCLLGAAAPCVLHGSNVERLGYAPGIFANQCLPYTGLYVIGSCFFGWNCLAPWFSYPTRTAIRHNFNLEGNFEELVRSFGCCGAVGWTRFRTNTVKPPVTLLPMSSAIRVRFVRKLVSFVGGFLTLDSWVKP
ncbi:UNVERIFIED_CONTAM: Cell number regulator 8 [Sesamum calycinum]|uniref:Cell number regulator 8 n=1 Tax=Sesamum calycinum TaxID=2727403 RepID=A0AAW2N3B2_9LAMI